MLQQVRLFHSGSGLRRFDDYGVGIFARALRAEGVRGDEIRERELGSAFVVSAGRGMRQLLPAKSSVVSAIDSSECFDDEFLQRLRGEFAVDEFSGPDVGLRGRLLGAVGAESLRGGRLRDGNGWI